MRAVLKRFGIALSVILLFGLFLVSGAYAQTGGAAGGAGGAGAGTGGGAMSPGTGAGTPGTGNFRSGPPEAI